MHPCLPLPSFPLRRHPRARGHHRSALALAGLLALATSAQAQPAAAPADPAAATASPCPPPHAAVLERFLSADCADCWAQPAPEPAALATPPGGSWRFDWIVPGRNADAALSAAALGEASDRLQRAALTAPATQLLHGQPADAAGTAAASSTVGAATGRAAGGIAASSAATSATTSAATPAVAPPVLRAHLGPGWLGRYMALEFVLSPATAWPAGSSGWLAMVELLPAGTDGSPVARALVRNVAGPLTLDGATPGQPLHHLRAMRWPETADPVRLQARAWVEGPDGRLLAVAADRCAGP